MSILICRKEAIVTEKATLLYVRIKRYLKSVIAQNKNIPHFKLPSENQIASRFHCSRIPVRRALDELEEEGYLYRQQGKGSFICHRLPQDIKAMRRSVCFLLPELGHKFNDDMLRGITEVLTARNTDLYLSFTENDSAREARLLQSALDRHFDGMLLFPTVYHTYNNTLLELVLRQFPLVLLGRPLPGLNLSSVFGDHYRQAYRITQYLIDRGHRNIGFLTETSRSSPAYGERLLGYRTCMLEHFEPSAVQQEEVDFFGRTFDEAALREAIVRLLVNRPTAVITSANALVPLYRLMAERGQESVIVATFDESYMLDRCPRTPIVVHQNPYQMGTTAAEQLCRQMDGQTAPQQIRIEEEIRDPSP